MLEDKLDICTKCGQIKYIHDRNARTCRECHAPSYQHNHLKQITRRDSAHEEDSSVDSYRHYGCRI